MTPAQLPQQRVYLVRGVPEPPAGWSPLDAEAMRRLGATKMPRGARYVGQVEWAWSPMNTRISAYYVSMDPSHRHWLLWIGTYDDNWGRWMVPVLDAAALRGVLGARTAAKLLLIHTWSLERDDGLDSFHWVNEADLLQAGEFNEISTAVWGDAGDDSDDAGEADEDQGRGCLLPAVR
jgi:hypothetical protein